MEHVPARDKAKNFLTNTQKALKLTCFFHLRRYLVRFARFQVQSFHDVSIFLLFLFGTHRHRQSFRLFLQRQRGLLENLDHVFLSIVVPFVSQAMKEPVQFRLQFSLMVVFG